MPLAQLQVKTSMVLMAKIYSTFGAIKFKNKKYTISVWSSLYDESEVCYA